MPPPGASRPAPRHHQKSAARGRSPAGNKAFHNDDDDGAGNLDVLSSRSAASSFHHTARPQCTATPALPAATTRYSTEHRVQLGRSCGIDASLCAAISWEAWLACAASRPARCGGLTPCSPAAEADGLEISRADRPPSARTPARAACGREPPWLVAGGGAATPVSGAASQPFGLSSAVGRAGATRAAAVVAACWVVWATLAQWSRS